MVKLISKLVYFSLLHNKLLPTPRAPETATAAAAANHAYFENKYIYIISYLGDENQLNLRNKFRNHLCRFRKFNRLTFA